jgi:hypothetical protein
MKRSMIEKRLPFKRCPLCGFIWNFRADFLEDPDLLLIGYQPSFKALVAGLFLFNHRCKATLAVKALDFHDLYTGPVFAVKATGSAQCPGHCLHRDDLEPCPTECECAYVRELLQIVRRWPKTESHRIDQVAMR